MTNGTALLRVPYNVVVAKTPWRTLPVPIEIQRYLNEKSLSKSYWNQCAYGPNQLGVVQAVYRKQPESLNKSPVNSPAAVQWFIDQVPLKTGVRVLDLNTGTGVVARAAAKAGAQVVGTDISRHMVSFATAASGGKIEFIRASSQQLPLPDKSFDIVLSRLAFNHISERDAVLSEITRVLKPGGFVGIAERVFPAEEWEERFELRFNSLERVRDPSHLFFMSVEEIKALLGANNINVSKVSTTEVEESLESYLNQTNTLPPNREHITQWVNGNIVSSDPDFNQITGFKPVQRGEEIILTHTHAFVGGVLTRE